MKKLVFALVCLSAIATAQSPEPAKLEFQDVEVTVPVSITNYPFYPLDYPGEVEVPLVATDKDGKGVGGVKVDWTITNSGKNPVYVLAVWNAGQRSRLKVKVNAGQNTAFSSTTDGEGKTKVLLNATDAGQARIAAKSGKVEARNLRGVAHQVDWIK